MPDIDIRLNLSARECLDYYEGHYSQVVARSLDGRRVAFPAEALRRVMTAEGVRGTYRIEVDEKGKWISIRACQR